MRPRIKGRDMKTHRTIHYSIKQRDARDAAARFLGGSDGALSVVRFPLAVRLEHVVLIVSFTLLAVTGLSQTYWDTASGSFLLSLFGGLDGTRLIHRAAAVLLGLQSIYHAAYWIDQWFVYRKDGMFLGMQDAADFIQQVKYNLGMSPRFPRFGRFNFEQKLQYWFLVLGILVLGASGLIQLFPEQVTNLIPAGMLVPLGRMIHRWQALLTVLVFLVWHSYQVLTGIKNMSIFTGTVTIDQMRQDHPLELAYLEKAAALSGQGDWPVSIEISINEGLQPAISDLPQAGDTEDSSKGNEI